MSANFREKRRI